MNSQQVMEVEESVALHNKQRQLDYMMQLAIDAHKEAKPMNTQPQFVRIGNTVVNLAQVTTIRLHTQVGYDNAIVAIVSFVGGAEAWFKDDDYDVAKAFFLGLAQEVK